jgi:hypothetical protein
MKNPARRKISGKTNRIGDSFRLLTLFHKINGREGVNDPIREVINYK